MACQNNFEILKLVQSNYRLVSHNLMKCNKIYGSVAESSQSYKIRSPKNQKKINKTKKHQEIKSVFQNPLEQTNQNDYTV